MSKLLPLIRRVENEHAQSVTIIPRGSYTEVEIGTDTAYVRIKFDDPNALRAMAGHMSTVADEMQRFRQEIR